jgi:hypothetical protein
MAATGIIRKYFLLRYTAENRAIAAMGVKLAGCGINLENAANKINSTAIIKFIILCLLKYEKSSLLINI